MAREDARAIVAINAGTPVEPDAAAPSTTTRAYSMNNSRAVELNVTGSGGVDVQTCLTMDGTFVTQDSVAAGAQSAPALDTGFVRLVVTSGSPTVTMRRVARLATIAA